MLGDILQTNAMNLLHRFESVTNPTTIRMTETMRSSCHSPGKAGLGYPSKSSDQNYCALQAYLTELLQH